MREDGPLTGIFYYQATGSWDCTVRLWPLGKGEMAVKCLKGHKSNIHAVSFSSTTLLVSALFRE